jgi:spermidine/putrescine transport system substrate-binding protein
LKVMTALVFPLLAWPLLTRADTLTLLTWEHYIAAEVVQAWEEKTGHTLVQQVYDTKAGRDTLFVQQKQEGGLPDLVILDEEASARFGKAGLLANLGELPKPPRLSVFSSGIDRCGDYAMPYFWGTLGLVYRKDKLSTPPDSWNVLFDPPAQVRGHIGLLDDPLDLPNSYFLWQGLRVDDASPKVSTDMQEALLSQTPFVLTYDYAITFMQNSSNADQLYLAMGYSGDQHTLNELMPADSLAVWDYVLPKEGSMIWTDCVAVRADSPKQAMAISLLTYLSEPAVAALNAEKIGFATPSKAAFDLLPEAVKQDLTLYPASGLLFKSQPYERLGEDLLARREEALRLVLLQFKAAAAASAPAH